MFKINVLKNKILFLCVSILTVLLTFSLNGVSTEATVKPESNFYITDYTGVIDDATRDYIIELNKTLSQTKEQPQIAVVVVPTLGGQTVEQYALEQFERMKIGNKDYDNGLLVLLSTNDRKIRIEVGYGLEGAITDGKAGRILDSAMSYLKKNDFSYAIYQIVSELNSEVQKEYGYLDTDAAESSSIIEKVVGFLLLIVLGVLSIILLVVHIVPPIVIMIAIMLAVIYPLSLLRHIVLCKKEKLDLKTALKTFFKEESKVGIHNPDNISSSSGGSSWGSDCGGGGSSGGGGASRDF